MIFDISTNRGDIRVQKWEVGLPSKTLICYQRISAVLDLFLYINKQFCLFSFCDFIT